MKYGICITQQLAWGLALLLSFGAQYVKAELISFDDLDPAEGTVSEQGYAGFDWDSRWALGSTALSGFSGVATSGTQFLFNDGLTSNLAVSRSNPFDFLGVSLAAPSLRTQSYWVKISAFDSENQSVGDTGYLRIGTTPSWVTLNFTNVSRLVFDPYGGLFGIDSLQFRNPAVAVSEAGGFVLLLIGLGGLWAARRRVH